MQRGRGSRDPFFGFGNPFGDFGGFAGMSGNHRSLMSDFFSGRDPFDEPFFTQPFGGMFESHFFGSNGSPFADMRSSAFIEGQPPEPKKARGPIIEELNSDDEKEEADKDKKENPRKHGRSSKEPYIEEPDDEAEERKSKLLQYRGSHNRFSGMEQQPQTRSYTFQSSTVTYGGSNGAYYTSSKTRRTGSDGVTIEESKEADTSSRQATHRISRGLNYKGHTLARKLNSDGKVDTMQTLHNLHEDELAGFEEAWKGNARKYLPGWNGDFRGHDMGAGSSGQNAEAGRGGWALPSAEQRMENPVPDARDGAGYSRVQHSGRMKGSSDFKDKSGYSRGRARE